MSANIQFLPLKFHAVLADCPRPLQTTVPFSKKSIAKLTLSWNSLVLPNESFAEKRKKDNSHPEQRLRKPATEGQQIMIVVQRT